MSGFGIGNSPRTFFEANSLPQAVAVETSASMRRRASAPSIIVAEMVRPYHDPAGSDDIGAVGSNGRTEVGTGFADAHGASLARPQQHMHDGNRIVDVLDAPEVRPQASVDFGTPTPFQQRVRELQRQDRYLPNRRELYAHFARWYDPLGALGYAALMVSDGVLMRQTPRPRDVRSDIFAEMGAVADSWFAVGRSKSLVQALANGGFLDARHRIHALPTIQDVDDLAPADIRVDSKRVVAILSEIKRMEVAKKLQACLARLARLPPTDAAYQARYDDCAREIAELTDRAAELAAASADQPNSRSADHTGDTTQT